MRINASRSIRKAALAASAASLAILFATPAMAQEAQGSGEEAEAPSEGIVVIGTRRADRTVTDSASPVDVIGSEDLATQSASNLLDTVKNVVPSFFVGQNTISDASTFVRAPSLRGLPGDQVLVMLNGKRFNRSALVQVYVGGDTALSFGSQGSDISVIPSIAIKNLQILRDGATAQYGSDAIGGVLNYGLRDDAGLEIQGRYGQTYEGDGKSYQIAANAGVKVGDRGFINLSAEFFDDGQTSRGTTRPVALVFQSLNAANPALVSQLPNFPGPVQIWGSSPVNGYKTMLNAGFEIVDQTQLYMVGNLAHSKGDQSFNYRSPISATNLQVNDGSGITTRSPGRNSAFARPIYLTACPAATPTCPTGGFVMQNLANTQQTYNFTSLYPAGFTPRFVGEVDQAFGVLGVKNTGGALTWDLAVSASRASLDLSMYNSLSPSYGPTTQTSFKFGKLIQTEFDVYLDMAYEIDAGMASPLTLSWGAEYRKEGYEQTAGDPQSYGAGPYASQTLYTETAAGVYAAVTPGACPVSQPVGATNCVVSMPTGASGYGGTSTTFAGKFNQWSYGAYVGLEGDLSDKFTFGLAGRWERYSLSGNTLVGKANFIAHLTDVVAVRGTVGTGFHAPSPGQNNVSILTTNFVAGNQVQTGTYPVTSSIAQFFNAAPLKPAKATNFGLGLVITPGGGFNLAIDGYSIRVRDRIGISRNFTVTPANIVALPDLIAVGAGGVVNYFTNSFSTTTDGVDVVATYKTEFLGGRTNLTLAYNYNMSRVTKWDPLLISDEQRADIRNLAPNHRLNASMSWQKDNWAFNVAERFYGSWGTENDYPGQKFGAKVTTDIDVSYTFMEHFTLTLGANNLFNTYPDKIAASIDNPIFLMTGSTADGQIYPRSGGPFGINGGFYYARLKIKY